MAYWQRVSESEEIHQGDIVFIRAKATVDYSGLSLNEVKNRLKEEMLERATEIGFYVHYIYVNITPIQQGRGEAWIEITAQKQSEGTPIFLFLVAVIVAALAFIFYEHYITWQEYYKLVGAQPGAAIPPPPSPFQLPFPTAFGLGAGAILILILALILAWRR